MTLYLTVALSFALGYLLQNASLLSRQHIASLNRLLNRVIIFIALPALILTSLPGLKVSYDHFYVLLTPWVVTALSFALVHILRRWFKWPKDISIAAALLLSLGNTAFLGIPLIRYQLGEEAVLLSLIHI